MSDSPRSTPLTRRSALAALALAPAALVRGAPILPPSIHTLEGRIRLPDGRCLGYADVGDQAGPLVLYFHGTPGSRIEVALIADDALACGVRLVSIDRPGVGLSTPARNRRVLDWPADAQAVADRLGYAGSAFGVIGVSGGAPYALACVCRIPERLTHVAICSGHTPMAEPGSGRGNQDALIEFVLGRPKLGHALIATIIRRLHKHPDKVMERVASQAAASDRQLLLGSADHRQGFHANLLAATKYGAGEVIHAMRLLHDPWGFRLAELPPAPISIWQGGCDPIAPPAASRYFHQQLAGSEYYFDPQAGHATMLTWHAREIMTKFKAPPVEVLPAPISTADG
jgi:pimeloyl-ACP methyl ester carboxylesterase